MAVTVLNREILAVFRGLSARMPKNGGTKSRFLCRLLKAKNDLYKGLS
jgi:hypothetical protein